MLRTFSVLAVTLLILVGQAVAADKEITGKIVKYDPETRKMTVKTAAGDEEFTIGADAKVLDIKGKESKDGPKDKALTVGAEVGLMIPDKAKTVKIVMLLPAKGSASASGSPAGSASVVKGSASGSGSPAGSASVVKGSASGSGSPAGSASVVKGSSSASGSASVVKGSASGSTSASAGSASGSSKGTPAKILKVDPDKGTFQVEINGKKTDLSVDADTEFIGPRGGVSKEKAKDDRFVVGAEISIEFDKTGKKVATIHLPYRKNEGSK